MDKRTFLKSVGLAGLGTLPFLDKLDELLAPYASVSAVDIAGDEDFWVKVRSEYRLKPEYINLENGYYCFMPQEILEHFIHHVRRINYEASYYLRTVQFENKKWMAGRLANIADCSPEELIITRNTTESLDCIIGGFPWQAGDEAVMAEQDYGAMLDMFELQARRHGIINKRISIPNHPRSDDEIVSLYENAITEKTRLLMVCHMINITGQILPVKKIIEMAHVKGVEVMVDGAHAFAHIPVSMRDLDCDYYGASLHKWLSAPIGAGILFVKKERINKIWPLFAEKGKEQDDISRLNHTGTHPVHTDLAIGNAIEYFLRLGPERKEQRLRYLQRYWSDKARMMEHLIVNTPQGDNRSCAIGNVGVRGMKPADLAKVLLEDHRIWTVAIDGAGVHGVRITPNIYTTTEELDTLLEALTGLG